MLYWGVGVLYFLQLVVSLSVLPVPSTQSTPSTPSLIQHNLAMATIRISCVFNTKAYKVLHMIQMDIKKYLFDSVYSYLLPLQRDKSTLMTPGLCLGIS